jgi:hypothetical protein
VENKRTPSLPTSLHFILWRNTKYTISRMTCVLTLFDFTSVILTLLLKVSAVAAV